MKRVSLTMLSIALAGCATAPAPHYYTLDMRASGKAVPPCTLSVERLRESEALGRREILIQRTPTEVEYYAVDQWTAALGELVSQKLQAEFGCASDDDKPEYSLSGTILDFGQVDLADGLEAYVRLDIEFRLPNKSRYSEPLFKKIYSARIKAEGEDAGAVVLALSRCLEQIAAEIAGDAASVKS